MFLPFSLFLLLFFFLEFSAGVMAGDDDRGGSCFGSSSSTLLEDCANYSPRPFERFPSPFRNLRAPCTRLIIFAVDEEPAHFQRPPS